MAPARLPQDVDGSRVGDAVEPGREGPAAILVAAEAFEHLHEDVGADILGLQWVAQPGGDVALDLGRVALVQRADCLGVAGLRARDQRGLRLGGRVWLADLVGKHGWHGRLWQHLFAFLGSPRLAATWVASPTGGLCDTPAV